MLKLKIMNDLDKRTNEQAESAIAKLKNENKNFILKTIPTSLWCAATIWGSITLALNMSAAPMYIILGAIASIGAIITTIKVYKKTI